MIFVSRQTFALTGDDGQQCHFNTFPQISKRICMDRQA